MGFQRHIAFMDGVTGYLGRWTLFWFLEELLDERVAVLIRPKAKGDKAQADAERRLKQILDSIGKTSESHRITVVPGNLKEPFLGNQDALASLRADCWLHIAGDVTFKKLGDPSSLVQNLDYTVNFVEAALHSPYPPRTLCHTSTFYVFEKKGGPEISFSVPEDFHSVDEMEHHNAYGYSKLKAEEYLRSLVQSGSLPFKLLIFRPDIIMHHIPVPEVSKYNPGLITDDFKVTYQLLAAILGQAKIKIPNGPTISQPLKYLPVNPQSISYMSDVDSVTKAMMQLTTLFAHGGSLDQGYQIFHLVNRWQPISNQFFRQICEFYDPEMTAKVKDVLPGAFHSQVLPSLPWHERLYYENLIEPFVGYMDRPCTIAETGNVDSLLGETWHNLHPAHGVDISQWLLIGLRQAIEKKFGEE
jgi:hypothetical protein